MKGKHLHSQKAFRTTQILKIKTALLLLVSKWKSVHWIIKITMMEMSKKWKSSICRLIWNFPQQYQRFSSWMNARIIMFGKTVILNNKEELMNSSIAFLCFLFWHHGNILCETVTISINFSIMILSFSKTRLIDITFNFR